MKINYNISNSLQSCLDAKFEQEITSSQEESTKMQQVLSETQSYRHFQIKEKIDFLLKEKFPLFSHYLEKKGVNEIQEILEKLSENECLFLFSQLEECIKKEDDFCIEKWFSIESQGPYRSFFLDCQRQNITCHPVDFIRCFYQLFCYQQDKMIEDYPLLFIECILKLRKDEDYQKMKRCEALLLHKKFSRLSRQIELPEHTQCNYLDLLKNSISLFTSAEGLFLFLQFLNFDADIDYNSFLELILSQASPRVKEILFLFNHFPQEIYYYILFLWKIKTYNSTGLFDNQKNIFKEICHELFFDEQKGNVVEELSNIKHHCNKNDLPILPDFTQNAVLNLIVQQKKIALKIEKIAISFLSIFKEDMIIEGVCHGIVMSFMYMCLDAHNKNENTVDHLIKQIAYFYKALQFDVSYQQMYEFSIPYLKKSLMLRFSLEEVMQCDREFYENHRSLYDINHVIYAKAFQKTHQDVAEWIDFFYCVEEIVLLHGLQPISIDLIKFNQTDSFYYKGDKANEQKKYPYKKTLQSLSPLDPCIYYFGLDSMFTLKVTDFNDILTNLRLLLYIQGMGNECIEMICHFSVKCIINNVIDNITDFRLSHALLLMKNNGKFYLLDDLTYQCFETAEELIQVLFRFMKLKTINVLNQENANRIDSEYRFFFKKKVNFEPIKNALTMKDMMEKLNTKEYFFYRAYIFFYELPNLIPQKKAIVDRKKELYDFGSMSDENIFYLTFNIDNQFPLTPFGEIVLDDKSSLAELDVKISRYYNDFKSLYSSENHCYQTIMDNRNEYFVCENVSKKVTNLTLLGSIIVLHNTLPICHIVEDTCDQSR